MIGLPVAEAARIQREGLVIILSGCSAEPSDELVEAREGYSLFRET